MPNVPAFLLYTGDFYKMEVSCASPMAQWVWMRLEMLMHDSTGRYGYLEIGGKPAPTEYIARRLGITVDETIAAIREIDDFNGISRDGKTIYSPRLVEQDVQRARKRKNVYDYRERQNQTNDHSSSDSDSSKSMEIQEDCNRPSSTGVTGTVTTPLEDENEDSICTSLPTQKALGKPSTRGKPAPPIPPELSLETAAALADGVERERLKHQSLAVRIALSAPAGISCGWTEGLVKSRKTMISPVYEAIKAEAKERRCSEIQAAEWMLGQVEELTAAVALDPGWTQYWSGERQARMFKSAEYRNPQKYAVTARNGGANGNGRQPGTSKNRSHAAAALEELERGWAQSEHGGSGGGSGDGASPASHHARSSNPLRPRALSVVPRGVSKGTGTSGTREEVSPLPARDPRFGW